MKVLVIPDVHLKPWIFDRAEELLKTRSINRTVCLMDLADDYDQQFNISLYEQTYDRAIEFELSHPDTLWCYGNHDLSYVWGCLETGFSTYAISTVSGRINKLRGSLPSLDQIGFVHRIDNVLFCHGGLTQKFVNTYVPSCKKDSTDSVIRCINRLSNEIMWNVDSPIWFRPQNSDEKMYKEDSLTQAVGHTPVKCIYKKGNVISCDVFSTHTDKTPIGTCEFPVIDTVTGEFESLK